MTQSHRLSIVLVVSLLSVSAGPAFAEVISGRVVKTGPASLAITVFDAQGRPYPNALAMKTSYRTKFSGITSPSALRLQDAVTVDVSRQNDGSWQAVSVTKLAASQTNLPKAAAPSNALADALKSPESKSALRGAATGAMTGAVASYASGGKAGKGALVGAGIGAAAGLVQALFNRPAPQQQAQPTNVYYDDRSSG